MAKLNAGHKTVTYAFSAAHKVTVLFQSSLSSRNVPYKKDANGIRKKSD
jgi:hypothetical protein